MSKLLFFDIDGTLIESYFRKEMGFVYEWIYDCPNHSFMDTCEKFSM